MPTDLSVDLWAPPPDAPDWRPLINVAGVESWLRDRGLGAGVAVHEGPDLPNDPGPYVLGSWLPGAGFTLEGVLSVPGLQLRTVGPQHDRNAARELAARIDAELVLRDAWPGFLGGRYVVDVRRAGGEPSHDRQDAANRAHYVCTYLIEHESL